MDTETRGERVGLRLRKRKSGETVVFSKMIAALSMMKGQPLVEFQIDVIEDRTAGIDIQVLVRAVQNILDEGGWRPDVEGILVACEKARCELRAALQFAPCESCLESPGYRAVGKMAVERCPCWHAHQAKVAALGVSAEKLALPAPRERDFSAVVEE